MSKYICVTQSDKQTDKKLSSFSHVMFIPLLGISVMLSNVASALPQNGSWESHKGILKGHSHQLLNKQKSEFPRTTHLA